jgi:starch phosphorylase
MKIAKMMVAGVHAWLNSPKRPLEASGTSGMKAALNGVPNISIMDGWWAEGYHDGQTGWKFGNEGVIEEANLSESPETLLYSEDSASFYQILPSILKEFYEAGEGAAFLDKAVMNLSLNIPIFNTHRMAAEYLTKYELRLPEEQEQEMGHFRSLYHSNR